MMKNRMNAYCLVVSKQFLAKLVCVALFVLCQVHSVWSQKLNASFDRSVVKMGEAVELILTVDLPKEGKIAFEPYDVELPAIKRKVGSQVVEERIALELIDAFKDTLIVSGKSAKWIGNYSLFVWDTGNVIVPEMKISINDSMYLFNEASLTVQNSTIGVKDELFDIEEGFANVADKLTFGQFILKYWYVVVAFLVVIGALIWIYIRNNRFKNAKNTIEMSLKERTLYAIEALEKRQLWKANQLKLHYTELSHIMRSYLSSRYELNLLESTTLETKTLLRQKQIPADTVETFMTILYQADLVKFANSTVDELTVLGVALKAKQIVSETSPLDIDLKEK